MIGISRRGFFERIRKRIAYEIASARPRRVECWIPLGGLTRFEPRSSVLIRTEESVFVAVSTDRAIHGLDWHWLRDGNCDRRRPVRMERGALALNPNAEWPRYAGLSVATGEMTIEPVDSGEEGDS